MTFSFGASSAARSSTGSASAYCPSLNITQPCVSSSALFFDSANGAVSARRDRDSSILLVRDEQHRQVVRCQLHAWAAVVERLVLLDRLIDAAVTFVERSQVRHERRLIFRGCDTRLIGGDGTGGIAARNVRVREIPIRQPPLRCELRRRAECLDRSRPGLRPICSSPRRL